MMDVGYGTYFRNITPVDRRAKIAMSKHPETEKWQRYSAREKDVANVGGDVGESVAHDADDEVLEEGGLACERGLVVAVGEEVDFQELIREFDDWQVGLLVDWCVAGCKHGVIYSVQNTVVDDICDFCKLVIYICWYVGRDDMK